MQWFDMFGYCFRLTNQWWALTLANCWKPCLSALMMTAGLFEMVSSHCVCLCFCLSVCVCVCVCVCSSSLSPTPPGRVMVCGDCMCIYVCVNIKLWLAWISTGDGNDKNYYHRQHHWFSSHYFHNILDAWLICWLFNWAVCGSFTLIVDFWEGT